MFLGALPATGAVLRIDARVTTTVQELIDAEPGSITLDDVQTGSDAPLPISARADLTSTDLEGELVALGRSLADVDDPGDIGDGNPEELAVEVAGYSNSNSVSYSVQGVAQETRNLVFTTPGNPVAPPDFDFGLATSRVVESSVFLSGAVILWSTGGGVALEDITAELQVRVAREGQTQPVFQTILTVSGDGNVVNTNTTGPIQFEIVGLAELSELGVDADSLAVLAAVERNGMLAVIVLGEQEHVYQYTVTADEAFDLVATFDVSIRNAPNGTGVAATFGRPFQDLVEIVELGLPGVDGAALQRSINAATAARKIDSIPASQTTPSTTLCGALGFEFGLLSLSGLALVSRRRRASA